MLQLTQEMEKELKEKDQQRDLALAEAEARVLQRIRDADADGERDRSSRDIGSGDGYEGSMEGDIGGGRGEGPAGCPLHPQVAEEIVSAAEKAVKTMEDVALRHQGVSASQHEALFELASVAEQVCVCARDGESARVRVVYGCES